MKMRICTTSFAAAVLFALAIPVWAQSPPQQGGGMAMKKFKVDAFVEKVDANQDGSHD
jgi:hypothetical protein